MSLAVGGGFTESMQPTRVEAPAPQADSGAPLYDPTDPMGGPPIPDVMLRRHGERMFGGVVALQQVLAAINERTQNYAVRAKVDPKRAREFYVRAAELAEVCTALEGRLGSMSAQVNQLVKARPELFSEKPAPAAEVVPV